MEIEITPTKQIGYLALLRVLFSQYPSHSVLGAALMITQSFLYNALYRPPHRRRRDDRGPLVAVFFAVDAEGKSLEDVAKPLGVIAKPLGVIAKPSEAIFRSGGHSGGLTPSAGD